MRPIKFRVWDTQLKEFSTDWTNRDPFLFLTTGDLFFYERANIFNQTGPDIICQDHGSRFVLQQYIGLNDYNGKEIYDGDIVSFGGHNYSIEYDQYKWVAKRLAASGWQRGFLDRFYDIRVGTIVGNIYQNPELVT